MLAPMASLQLQADSGYLFSELESRVPRVVGTAGKPMFAGTLSWTILDEEWAEFVAWWEGTEKGVLPFELSFITGAVARTHTCQALKNYKLTRDTGKRKVDLEVKITDRPTGLALGWDDTLYGPPALFPPSLPMPQWGFRQEEQSLFLSTSGAATAARPMASRGERYSLEWKALSGTEFDALVDWWAHTLAFGRRKFKLAFPGHMPWLCRLTADPSFVVDGASFSASLDLVATEIKVLPPQERGYLYDTWQDTAAVDTLSDAFEDEVADILYDVAGA